MEKKSTKEKKKVVALNPTEDTATEKKVTETVKYTYEELENIVQNLVEQYNNAVARLRQYEEMLNLKRLDYLFNVLSNKTVFSKEFVAECIKEIEFSLTGKEEEKKEETEVSE